MGRLDEDRAAVGEAVHGSQGLAAAYDSLVGLELDLLHALIALCDDCVGSLATKQLEADEPLGLVDVALTLEEGPFERLPALLVRRRLAQSLRPSIGSS